MARARWRPFNLFFAQLARRGRAGAADYVFQIMIVIIGVYVGIALEGKASDRDRTRKAHTALAHLAGDLKRDDADMASVLQAQQDQARALSEIAQWLARDAVAPSVRMDSLLQKALDNRTVYPRRGVYSSMISAGQLALLPADLASSILNLYENTYARLAANGEQYDSSLERDYFAAYMRAWDPASKTLLTPENDERIRFRNTVLVMHAWNSYYRNLLAQSRSELQAVIHRIDRSRGSSQQ